MTTTSTQAPHSAAANAAPEHVDEWLRATIAEYAGERVDVAHALCDRHTGVALDYIDPAGHEASFTYEQLGEWSRQCASVLASLGVGAGDRVATLLPKSPELLVTVLAIFRLGAVHLPLFTAFGPEAVSYRLDNAGAAAIVTDTAQVSKLGGATLPSLVVGATGAANDFWSAVRHAPPLETNVTRRGSDLLIVLYTSGTTGQPKGALIPVRALAAFEGYMRLALDLRPDDKFWNIADPGWAYGLYFALIGPMQIGHRTLFVNAPFSPEATWRLLRDRGITNFAAAPTVYRALRVHGASATALHPPPRLRVASSAGEPLNPEVIRWAEDTIGCAIHDQYGQTELGMLVNNHHHRALARPLRPGSMGHPTPGFRVVIVDDDGRELPPGVEGQIAVDISQSPLYWFQGYLDAPDVTAQRMVRGRYNVTGDVASADAEGYIYFAGRGDDVINSGGFRIGPFEIESQLMQHPAVAESAAVEKPDALRGGAVCAFVVLKPGISPSDSLARELKDFVKTRLAAHAFPRDVRFVAALPKTPSGKVQRFMLRATLTD